MAEVWVVDGYNLLWAMQKHKNRDLRLSRLELCQVMAGMASLEKIHICLYFDGIGPQEEWAALQTNYFQVQYSGNMNVDSVIERYLHDNARTRRVTVVTSDRAISNIASGFGALVVSTDEFMHKFVEFKKSQKEHIYKQENASLRFNRPFSEKLKDVSE